MLASFPTLSESEVHVAPFTPQEFTPQQQPSTRERQGFEEADLGGRDVLEGQAPPGGRDLPKQRTRRAWAPNGDDHLIYRMVKLDGSGQDFVAQCFGIHQSTVSRIVRRYERWEAHAAARDDGRLDPAERLRSLHWLAFERNEAMLARCLRLASEMERCKELSKSVTHYPQSYPTAETEVRNESWVLDRVGMAARFLRLAFRINMEQVKLAEAEPPPLPEPLTEEEVAEQEAQAAEERAEIVAVRERSNQEVEATQRALGDQLAAARYEAEQARRDAAAAREEAAAARQEAEAARREADEARAAACLADISGRPVRDRNWRAGDVSPPMAPHYQEAHASRSPGVPATHGVDEHKMHNLHTPGDAKSGASAEPDGVYATKASAEKICGGCMHTPQALPLEAPLIPRAATNDTFAESAH